MQVKMALLALVVLLTSGLMSCLQAANFTPKNLRFGLIENFELIDDAPFIWSEDEFGAAPSLEDGEAYAVLTVKLAKDKSIGKYDYTLSGNKCLGIAAPGMDFDPGTWEQKSEDSPNGVQLIYIVDRDKAPYTLTFNYNVPSIAASERNIILGTELVTATPAPSAIPDAVPEIEEATPEVIPEAAPEPEPIKSDPEPKTAPEPEAEVKPEPAPEPKVAPKEPEKPKAPEKKETPKADTSNAIDDLIEAW